MAIEKDVLLRLKVEKGREGQAFSDVAKGAEKADKAVKRAGGAIAEMLKETRKSAAAAQNIERVAQALQKQGIAADRARDAAAKLLRQIGTDARVSKAEIDKLATGMRALGQGGPMGGGGGLFARLNMGQMFGMGTAFMFGRAALQSIQRRFETTADEEIRRTGRGIPGRPGTGVRARDLGFSELEMGISETISELPGFSGLAAMMTATDRRAAERSVEAARRRAAENVRRMQDREERGAQAGALRAAQVGAGDMMMQALFAGTGAAGMGRDAALIAQVQRREQTLMRGRVDAAAIRAEAGRGVRFGGGALAAIGEEIGHERARIGIAERARVAGETTLSYGEQVQLATEIEERQRRILEHERRRGEIQQQNLELDRERLTRLRDFADLQEQTFRAQAEAERQRTRGLRDQFGLMDEMSRREILEVSRGVVRARGAAGVVDESRITGEMLDVMRRNPELFRQALGEVAAQRGGPGFAEIRRNLGLDEARFRAERQAEEMRQVSVELTTQIEARITLDEPEQARRIAEALLPQIQAINLALEAKLRAEFTRREAEAAAARAAAGGGV